MATRTVRNAVTGNLPDVLITGLAPTTTLVTATFGEAAPETGLNDPSTNTTGDYTSTQDFPATALAAEVEHRGMNANDAAWLRDDNEAALLAYDAEYNANSDQAAAIAAGDAAGQASFAS